MLDSIDMLYRYICVWRSLCFIELECGTTGKMLLLACESGVACAIDVASRKQVVLSMVSRIDNMFRQVFTKQLNGGLNCCTFIGDNTAVYGGDKGEIIMVDLRNTRCIFTTIFRVCKVVLCNTINTTRYRDTKVVVLTLKFDVIGIEYAIWPDS